MLASFYTEAAGGLLFRYFREAQQYDRDTIIQNLVFILQTSVVSVLRERAQAYDDR